MASLMCICSGLVGPKSENVKKVFVLSHFLKFQRGHEDPRTNLRPSGPGLREVEQVIFFDVKCFLSILRIVLPALAGGTRSEKSRNKMPASGAERRKC